MRQSGKLRYVVRCFQCGHLSESPYRAGLIFRLEVWKDGKLITISEGPSEKAIRQTLKDELENVQALQHKNRRIYGQTKGKQK